LERHWALLREIPRSPRNATTAQLESALASLGFKTTRRTLERDLSQLCGSFPIAVDDSARPFKWFWMADAQSDILPRLNEAQCTTLLLAEAHLRPLLPSSLASDLQQVFGYARRQLKDTAWADWHRRTAVVDASVKRLAPDINPSVLDAIHRAMATSQCVEIEYRAKGATVWKKMVLHPLGILVRGPVHYAVGTLFDYDDVRQLAIHRIRFADVIKQGVRVPKGFNFQAYALDAAGSHHQGVMRIELRIEAAAAEHLLETPLSRDQKIVATKDSDWMRLTAAVANDDALRWWLLGFGAQIEVLKPASLRREIKAESQAMARRYG